MGFVSNPPMTRRDVEAVLKVSRRTLYALQQSDPLFPRPFKIRGLLRWDPRAIEKYLAARAEEAANAR